MILAAWAGLYGNLGQTFWIVAALVMLIASVCFAMGLRLELRNHHWYKWQYNGVFCIMLVVAFSLGGPVIVREITRKDQIAKKPPLKLFVTSLASPESKLDLTNASLFWSSARTSQETGDCLVIPTAANETNAVVIFGLGNDEPILYEEIELTILFPDELKIKADRGWGDIVKQSDGRMGIAFSVPIPLHGRRWYRFSPMSFGTTKAVQFVTVSIDAKEMETVRLAFWVLAEDFGGRPKAPFLVKNDNTESNRFRFKMPKAALSN